MEWPLKLFEIQTPCKILSNGKGDDGFTSILPSFNFEPREYHRYWNAEEYRSCGGAISPPPMITIRDATVQDKPTPSDEVTSPLLVAVSQNILLKD